MAEQFLERKIKTLFTRFDADSSGHIEESDFNKWADRLIALGNLNAEQGGKLKENLKNLWNAYFTPADADKSGSVSSAELVAHIKKTIGDETKRATLRETLPLIFDAIDSDKSGSVTKAEFANYFKSLNINDDAVATQVFTSMDSNGDGSLSKEEFQQFGGNFFTSQDENDPSRLFFGPLV